MGIRDDLNELEEKVKKYIQTEKMFGNTDIFSDYKEEKEERIIVGKDNMSKKEKQGRLKELAKEISECHQCELNKTRTNAVPGEGNPDADLVFIGEAPGREEDEQGRPFVGKAGKLLTKIIKAMGMFREEVFITNILKCRPPNNRNPYPYEIAVCEPYLLKQIKIIQPKIICTLGKYATESLLGTEVSITKIRGSFQEYHGVEVMPTYHPAYLLRNVSQKKLVWDDMKKVLKSMGRKVPKNTKNAKR